MKNKRKQITISTFNVDYVDYFLKSLKIETTLCVVCDLHVRDAISTIYFVYTLLLLLLLL